MVRCLLPVIAALALLLASRENQPPLDQHGCAPPKVIAFTTAWCGPCKAAKPSLVQMKAAGVQVEIVDIDQNPDLARQYGITSVPTFLVYVCGRKAVRTQDVAVVVALTRSRCE